MKAIVCMDINRNIGRNNKLLVSIPEDMQSFKNLTMGKTVIMGRKTFESIGRELRGRDMVVLSSDHSLEDRFEYITVYDDINTMLERVPANSMVIGGSQIYELLLPYCTEIYVTQVLANLGPADTKFPELPNEDWELQKDCCFNSHIVEGEPELLYRFDRYRRKQPELTEALVMECQKFISTSEDDQDEILLDLMTDICNYSYSKVITSNEKIDPWSDKGQKIIVSMVLHGYYIWKQLVELMDKTVPDGSGLSELAFFFYLEWAGQSANDDKGRPILPYHDAIGEVIKILTLRGETIEDLSDNLSDAVEQVNRITDENLLSEFFKAFSDLGTLYRDPSKYQSEEDLKKFNRLMNLYKMMRQG